jgi:hypothetical protein
MKNQPVIRPGGSRGGVIKPLSNAKSIHQVKGPAGSFSVAKRKQDEAQAVKEGTLSRVGVRLSANLD